MCRSRSMNSSFFLGWFCIPNARFSVLMVASASRPCSFVHSGMTYPPVEFRCTILPSLAVAVISLLAQLNTKQKSTKGAWLGPIKLLRERFFGRLPVHLGMMKGPYQANGNGKNRPGGFLASCLAEQRFKVTCAVIHM